MFRNVVSWHDNDIEYTVKDGRGHQQKRRNDDKANHTFDPRNETHECVMKRVMYFMHLIIVSFVVRMLLDSCNGVTRRTQSQTANRFDRVLHRLPFLTILLLSFSDFPPLACPLMMNMIGCAYAIGEGL
jgi:hypothetical protein